MRILHRYVLQLYFKVLLICFLSLSGLFIVIDAFGNLDEFLTCADGGGGLVKVLTEYYGARLLTFFDRTCGLLSLIAAMFAITWLQRTNELTAILAAGIPKRRMLTPLIVAAIGVSILGVLNREFMIPKVSSNLTRNAQNWLGTKGRAVHPRYDAVTDILINGRHTFAKEQRLEKPSFGLPPELHGLGRQLMANNAFFIAGDDQRPRGYLLRGEVSPETVLEQPTVKQGDKPVILTPRDTPWLSPDECFVVCDVPFDELSASAEVRQYSSTAALIRGLHNKSLNYGADVRVTVHSRFLQPLLDMTLLMLGVPIVLAKENRNVFVAAGWGLLVVASFFVIVLACHSMGRNYIPGFTPSLAAWCPLIILAPIATYLSRSLWD